MDCIALIRSCIREGGNADVGKWILYRKHKKGIFEACWTDSLPIPWVAHEEERVCNVL